MENLEKIRLCAAAVETLQRKHQKPMCRLEVTDEPFALTDSHLGGVPYLPHGTDYPMGADGQALWLCAQINFAQMPPLPDFPREGILQIFLSNWRHDGSFGLDVDSRTQDNWRVLYHPTVDETVTETECQAKMPQPWERKEDENGEDPWRTPKQPQKLRFLPVQQDPLGDENFLFDPAFAEELERLYPGASPKEFGPYALKWETPEERAALEDVHKAIEQGGCKMGGYPRYLQSDPREDPYVGMTEETMRKYNITIPPDMVEKAKTGPQWDTLLFQLDDDTFTFPAGETGGMNFDLNGGTLNFLIRREDLLNRDFSQVWGQWACT